MLSDTLNVDHATFSAADIQVIGPEGSEFRRQTVTALVRRGHRASSLALPAIASAVAYSADLLVLEPDAGDPDALSLCLAVRAISKVPILVIVPLTARSRGIQALDLGADSFILAPFDRRELVARCEALIRRYRRK